MIDFPSSPTNGQVVTLAGNQYTYNLAKTQWQVTTPSVSTNIGGGSLGTIPYQSALNTTAMLATSTSGYLLTSNGVGAAPSWQAAPVSLPTQTSNSGKLLTTDGTTASWTSNIGITGALSVGTATLGTAGQIIATGSITAMYSDKRLKENIKPITNALDKVDSLTGMLFTQNALAESFGYTNKEQQVGVFAQDIQKVLPEAVKLAPFDMDDNGNSKSGENYLTVQYEKLVPLLIEAIKELRLEVNELKGL